EPRHSACRSSFRRQNRICPVGADAQTIIRRRILTRRLNTLGQTPHAFVDLRRRERAKRQPEEPLAAPFGEEGQTVGEVEAAPGSLCSHGSREHTLWER